jgi:group I intron endonuclease
MGAIYRILNTVTGKYYIGQTIKLPHKRWAEHIKTSKTGTTNLYISMRKHGTDVFHFKVIEVCDDSLMNDREQFWIKHYDSYHNGYNMTFGGYLGSYWDDPENKFNHSSIMISYYDNNPEAKDHIKKIVKASVENGTHNLLKRPDGTSVASDAVSNGTHNLLKRPDGTSVASDRVANGTHHLLGGEIHRRRVREGTHPSQIMITCIHCRTTMNSLSFGRYHGDNCSENPDKEDKGYMTVCEHCEKTVTKHGHSKWHGDKCKNNPDQTVRESSKILCDGCGIKFLPPQYGRYHGEKCKTKIKDMA